MSAARRAAEAEIAALRARLNDRNSAHSNSSDIAARRPAGERPGPVSPETLGRFLAADADPPLAATRPAAAA